MFTIPAEAIGGVVAGASTSLFVLAELPNDSWLAKQMFGSHFRTIVTTTVFGLAVGALVGPLAGLAFDFCIFPACWFKTKMVQSRIEAEKAVETFKAYTGIRREALNTLLAGLVKQA
jgi:MFS superfamily sulfate permease-like transporter